MALRNITRDWKIKGFSKVKWEFVYEEDSLEVMLKDTSIGFGLKSSDWLFSWLNGTLQATQKIGKYN